MSDSPVNPALAEEQEYLGRVLGHVRNGIVDSIQSQDTAKRNVVEARKYMWENLPHGRPDSHDLEALTNIYQVRRDMNFEEKELALEEKKLRRLERQADSPYFGRVDFRESGYTRLEKIYIGTFALSDDYHEPLVYDWRAPVCSMFYEDEVGPAEYECPAGTIRGDLHLKRQFSIKGGVMRYMFDSSLKIDDDILQEVLAKATDDRMKTIVSSIQREQNQAIRDERHKLLVVHGGAGSGKTSIALHRAAYLLYHNRDTMTASSILIFSPNRIFSDYISGVLPELGEENITQTTWADFARVALQLTGVLEDWSDQAEALIVNAGMAHHRIRAASVLLKGSREFAEAILSYVDSLAEKRAFTDIVGDSEVILSKGEQRRLFLEEYSFLPPFRRLEKLARRAEAVLDEWSRNRRAVEEKRIGEEQEWLPSAERKNLAKEAVRDIVIPIREQLGNMFNSSWRHAYHMLFQDSRGLRARLEAQPEGKALLEAMAKTAGLPDGDRAIREVCRYTLDSLGAGRVDFEDSAPLFYLRNLLWGVEERSGIKHVIVDEAQDYTPCQYRVIKQLFPWASHTVLGDLNQGINPYSSLASFEDAVREMSVPKSAILRLSRTYRSTQEISEFAGRILPPGSDLPEPMQRFGGEPRVVGLPAETGDDTLAAAVLAETTDMKAGGANSIAVICRSAKEARAAMKALGTAATAGGLETLHLVEASDDAMGSRTVVIPSYLAKGLEFDGVVLWDATPVNYGERDRRLLYTVCTRALHRLTVFHRGPATTLLR